MKKERLHLIRDYGTLLALITAIATVAWQDGHEHSWKNNFSQQLADIKMQVNDIKTVQKENSMANSENFRKIYEILIARNADVD